MAEQYRKWYSSAMTYYDDIYEFAADNHFLISTSQAAEVGIPPIELAKLAHRGKLENISRGLYRLTRNIPTENDPYAVAVARVGSEAYLYGESVLAMLGLAETDPSFIYVTTPVRTRKKLPSNIRKRKPSVDDEVTLYDGIRSQTVGSAIRSARSTMMPERLVDALDAARREGFVLGDEYQRLKDELDES